MGDTATFGLPMGFSISNLRVPEQMGGHGGATNPEQLFAAGDRRTVGNAVTQLARAQGAKHAMSSTTNHAKAEQAKALGFNVCAHGAF